MTLQALDEIEARVEKANDEGGAIPAYQEIAADLDAVCRALRIALDGLTCGGCEVEAECTGCDAHRRAMAELDPARLADPIHHCGRPYGRHGLAGKCAMSYGHAGEMHGDGFTDPIHEQRAEPPAPVAEPPKLRCMQQVHRGSVIEICGLERWHVGFCAPAAPDPVKPKEEE